MPLYINRHFSSEILPLRLRQRGSSISTASNWYVRILKEADRDEANSGNTRIFNYMIVQITPIAIQNIGWRTYIIFAVLNATWVPVIFLFFPETKGMQLEDVDRLFAGDALLAEHYGDKSPEGNLAEDVKASEIHT